MTATAIPAGLVDARHALAELAERVGLAAAAFARLRIAAFGGIMPRLSSVTPDEASIAVPCGGGEALTVVYRTSRVTPKFLQQLQKAETDGSIVGSLITPLSELLVSWDLLTDDETPIPTTARALEGVPFGILTAVLRAIAAQLAAGATNGHR